MYVSNSLLGCVRTASNNVFIVELYAKVSKNTKKGKKEPIFSFILAALTTFASKQVIDGHISLKFNPRRHIA